MRYTESIDYIMANNLKHIKSSHIYPSSELMIELLDNLSPTEVKLYLYYGYAPLTNPDKNYFSNETISNNLKIPIGTVKNAKHALKRKDYLRLSTYANNNGQKILKIILGRENTILHDLGFEARVVKPALRNRLLHKFNFEDPNIGLTERKELLSQANQYIKNNPTEFL